MQIDYDKVGEVNVLDLPEEFGEVVDDLPSMGRFEDVVFLTNDGSEILQMTQELHWKDGKPVFGRTSVMSW